MEKAHDRQPEAPFPPGHTNPEMKISPGAPRDVMATESQDRLSRAEQLTLWALRRLRQNAASPFGEPHRRPAHLWRELDESLQRLRAAEAILRAERGMALRLASPGHLGITADEWTLVRATAAAQAEDTALLARELASLLQGSGAGLAFQQAVTLLAAVLAAQGHWLPQPCAQACAPLHPAFDASPHPERHAHAFRFPGHPA